MTEFFIDNIFVRFGGQFFQQTICIPMDTDCAPLLANVSPYSYWAVLIARNWRYYGRCKVCSLSWPSSWNDTAERLNTKVYDKRDDFDFLIVSFPYLSSKIPEASVYGVYISHLIRYHRACDMYTNFIDRARLQLLNQRYVDPKLRSPFLNILVK